MKTKPIQRTLSLISALAMILTVFAVPALAAPTASAALTAGQSVFPTADGATRDFTVRVDNTGTPIIGERINTVRIMLPTNETGIALKDTSTLGTAPSGWTATGAKSARINFVEYKANSPANAIMPGANLSFTFPAVVPRPLDRERSGGFTVFTSSDGGATNTTIAGDALATTVEILEILNDLSPRSPSGAVDRSGTSGQTITYGYSVRNHALNAVSVTGELGVSDATVATITNPTTLSVPGDPASQTLFTHPVALGPVDADRNVVFDAAASATGATAEQRPTDTFRILVASILELDADSFSPKFTGSGAGTDGRQFTIDAERLGTPQLTVNSGSLTFAGTTATLQETPKTFGEKQRLTFMLPDGQQVTGADGVHDATFTFDTVDENGFPQTLTVTLDDLITIDSLAPVITLKVGIPAGQTAVKNGDIISVEGTVTGVDAVPSTLKVKLQPDLGDATTVTVSTQKTEDGYTFAGSAPANFQTGNDPEKPTTPYARTFTGTAEIADQANNIGAVSAPGATIDNVIPGLTGPGRTGRDGTGKSTIQIKFDDVHPLTNDLRGGCDPRLYRIDGIPGRVSEVRFFGDTESCLGKDAAGGSDGTRVLVLNFDLGQDETPTVTYLLSDASSARGFGMDPIRDGALNDAVRRTIDTIVGIAPAAPDLIEVTRNNGSESAYKDFDGSYWTRFGGEDLKVTFAGFEDGYTIQVLDGNGAVLKSEKLTRDKIPGTDQDAPGESGQRTISVPLPAAGPDTPGVNNGANTRSLRFLAPAASAPAGEKLALIINIDTVAPAISTLSRLDQTVTVSFTDQLVEGTNFASDWFGFESHADGERSYTAEEVSTTDSPSERQVRFGFEDPMLFSGIEYFLNSGTRYGDRGGNGLADEYRAA